MKELHRILNENTQLTTKIEINYPELYRFPDENPYDIKVSQHSHMDKKVLKENIRQIQRNY